MHHRYVVPLSIATVVLTAVPLVSAQYGQDPAAGYRHLPGFQCHDQRSDGSCYDFSYYGTPSGGQQSSSSQPPPHTGTPPYHNPQYPNYPHYPQNPQTLEGRVNQCINQSMQWWYGWNKNNPVNRQALFACLLGVINDVLWGRIPYNPGPPPHMSSSSSMASMSSSSRSSSSQSSQSSMSSSSSQSSQNPQQGLVEVFIGGFQYNPPTITVRRGTTVRWIQVDANVQHTVTSDTGIGPMSPLLSTGQTYSYTFTTTGTFPYHCMPHPHMKGTVIVVD